MMRSLRRLFLFLSFLFAADRLSANCPNINASFTATPTNICGPGFTPISFINTSTGAGAAAGQYNWYRNNVFFDQTNGLSAPNNSSVNGVGTYTFMVVAENAAQTCTDTAFVLVTVWPVPVASFTFNPNNSCAGGPITFTNTSTGTAAGTTYAWNFGDAGTSTLASPTHTYAAGGTYNVTLTVTNFAGCTSTFSMTVTALPIPAVSIAGDDGDGNTINCLLPGDTTTIETVAFSNFTTGATSYTWNFGDASAPYTTANNNTFNHTYLSYGTYTVTMTATGPNGCTATATLVVVFERYVGASFSVPINQMSGCLPLTVTPINASQNATTYTWNFGDATPPITTTSPIPPSHTYTTPGTYTITLTASNSCNTSVSTVSPIIVVGPPVLNFTANPTLGCANQFVTFSNTSTGASPANNFQWNFGNGNTLNNVANPPGQTYGQGTWTITLIGGSACGTDTIQRVIVVDTLPALHLTVNPTNGCTPLTVISNNTSTGGNLSYQWFVDNAFVSSAVNIGPQTFTAPPGNTPTTHTIHLHVSNHCGAHDSTVTITVHPAVVASFTPLATTLCQGGSVTFTQNSQGDNLTYQWDFGNGNTSTTAGPHTQTYNTPGTHTVTLIVNGFCGADTIQGTVTVNPTPVADISASVTNGCEDLSVNFTNNSTVGGTYAWNFGASSLPASSAAYTPPTVVFPNPGTQNVILVVTVLGCVNSDTIPITILPRPVPVFSAVPNSGCTPLNVSFTNSTTAAAGNIYAWTFGNGNTSSAQNPGGQTYIANANDSVYQVELVVTNAVGCADSITHPVTVHPLPVAAFSMSDDTVCALDNIIFTNNSTGISTYNWNFGDAGTSTTTSPVHAYSSAGSYTVTLIANTAFGCRDTITAPVFVDSIPFTAFTSSVECVGNATTFTNSTTGNVVTWNWNFGDATSSSAQSPTHTYASAGTYNVTLTATNTAGCSQFITHPVVVNVVPTAAFASTTACLGQATAFTDQTNPVPNGWQWDFGDASAAGTTQNPSHTYASAGTYTTTLIATAGTGCADTISNTITVNPVPTAAFTFTSVCMNDSLFFNSTSLGNPTTFSWNFGDASALNTNQNPSHIYSAAGTYNVTLTAGYATGCTNSITLPVVVYPRTVPAFTSNIPCLGGSTNFTDATANSPTSWQWNFGDASALNTNQNPSHVYSGPGTYSVTLVTQNSFGCTDSIQNVVTVYPLPVAAFTADTVCQGAASSFTDNSVSAASWNWDFGDASPISTQASPVHTYAAQGTYTVTLVVWNPQGCTDTITHAIIVNPNPVSAFTATTACHTYATQYTDNSTAAVNWQWDFGDASPVNTNQSPAYTFANPGTYTTTLVVGNIFGCTDTSSQAVTVLPQPQAGFISPTLCARELVVFTDTTTNSPTQWSWDFGDASPVDLNQDPSHTYALGGTYSITLIAGNSAGCIDTLVQAITVNTIPTPFFSANTVCLGNITSFTDGSTDVVPITGYFWDFGDGNNSFATNPTYIYQAPGVYNVTLTITNANGCDSTYTFPVTVTGIPVADFTFDTVCVGSATTFTDISTGNPGTWLWDFGDATTSTVGPVVQHVYATSGTYLVSEIVSGGAGCTDQVFHVVTVSNSVVAGMTVTDSTCTNAVVTLTDNSVATIGNITSWNWNFGDTTPADTNTNTTHIYTSPGTYTITHTVSANSGCASVITQDIVVNPLPVALFTSTNACEQEQTQFTDLSSGNPNAWNWDFGDASTSNLQNPSHIYAASGTYNASLIITTPAGCSDTTGNTVIVYPKPVAAFTSNVVCFGDTTLFTDQSSSANGNIVSWNWDFGDGNNGTQQNPSHEFVMQNDSFNVTLIVQNNEGCSDTVTQLVQTYPLPDLNFYPIAASGCEDFTTQFYDSSTVFNGNIVNWLWNFGDGNFGFGQSPIHTYVNSGSYDVTLELTTSYGCTLIDSLNYPIVVYPKPVAAFTPDPVSISVLTPHIDFIDASSGAMNWQWDFGDNSSSIQQYTSHDYADTGTYHVTQVVINQYGCSDTTVRTIIIESEFQFFIPNAFTPNGNVTNEIFNGEGIGIADYHMMIFDRWGNLIFESTDMNQGWNGTLNNGVKAEIDVYVYKFVLKDVFGNDHTFIGHVSLIR